MGESRPTRVRYAMVALAMMVAVLLYVDRIALSVAEKQVKADLLLDKPQWALVMSAFFWSYALAQIPAGWLGDRFGARFMLAVYLALWSAVTAFTGWATGLWSLFVLRLLCGLFEAGAYPVAGGIVSRWMPPSERGWASGIVAVGGRLGGVVAPTLTMMLMIWWAGGVNQPAMTTAWRPVMILYGVVGIGVALVFWWAFRDRPSEHPAVNPAEADLIGTPAQREPLPAIPWHALLTHRALWCNALTQFGSNFGWAFIITLLPQYLQDVHQVDDDTKANLQGLPLLVGIVGMLAGGPLTDVLTRRWGLRWGRVGPIVLGRVLGIGAFLGCVNASSPWLAVAMMALVACAIDLGVPAIWAHGQDVGGRYVGVVSGWANMFGNFGAAVSPLVYGWLLAWYGADVVGGYNAAFVVSALVLFVTGIISLGIDARTPLVPQKTPA
jgi:MFS family permease